jgi:outer membrane protein assembly factor BamB
MDGLVRHRVAGHPDEQGLTGRLRPIQPADRVYRYGSRIGVVCRCDPFQIRMGDVRSAVREAGRSMKSLSLATVLCETGLRTSRGALSRVLGVAPAAALLICGLFTVWAGPLAPPVAAASGDWPQFRSGPDHSGHNSSEALLSTSNVAGLGVSWTAAIDGSTRSSPVVADGVVYVGSDHGLYAFAVGCGRNGGTCTPLWRGATSSSIDSTPAVDDGVVYVGSATGDKLYAFAVGCGTGGATCSPLWTGSTGGAIDSSPAVADGVVYVGSGDHKLYAFEVGCATGGAACTPLWTGATGGAIHSSPAVDTPWVYVGSDDGSLYAFEVGCATGGAACTPLWTGATGGAIHSSPAVDTPWVYVGSGHNFYVFYPCRSDGGSCTPLETFATGGTVDSSPAVAGSQVYVGSGDGELYAFPAGFDLDCYVGGECSPLWTATAGGPISSSPAFANGVVYVGSEDGSMYAWWPALCYYSACLPSWTASTGGAIVSSPAVSNGVVYISSSDQLYAYSLAVDHLELSPGDATIAAGESQAYAAAGLDIWGDGLGDDTANTTFTISGSGSCTDNQCTSTQAGDHTVTGTDTTATGTATLHVTHAALDHLVLSPSEATIAAGGSRAYTATGFDAYGNTLGDVTSATTFSITGTGSCTGTSCTSTQAGDQTVTGADGSAVGTATLHVTHGPASSLILNPTRKTILPGESQAYSATGIDVYGTAWNDTAATTFTITGEGSCTDNSCTATGPGNHTVTGTDGSATDTATLHVFSIAPGDWPQYHKDASHAGDNAHETTLSASSVVNLGVSWTADTGVTMFSSPTVADGVVYVVTGDGYLEAFAVGCASGGEMCTPLWIGTSGDHVYGLNGSAVVADGEVFVGGEAGMYAFPVDCRSDGGTCAPLWRGPAYVGSGYAPAVADGVVYFAGGDKKLYAFADDCRSDGGTCSPLWTATSTLGGYISGAPTVADGRVFVAFETFGGWWYSSTLYAFDAAGATGCSGSPKTCSPLWTATPDGGGVFGTPTVADGVAYVTGSYGYVYAYAVDCASGGDACQPLWEGWSGGTASPAVANGVVYVGAPGSLYAFPAACRSDGGICAPLWTGDTGGGSGNSPAVANGVVYVASSDGNLYAFDANGAIDCSGPTDYVTCLPLWTAATKAEQMASVSPAVANGVVYVGDAIGILYAFGLDHGALDHLVLSPDHWPINAGGSKSYKAEGFDTHGNSWDVTALTTFTVSGGSCTGNVCTSTLAGDDTVTGTVGTATGTATLHVNPGSVASLVVTPSGTTVITAGQSQTYTAEGFDAYGNDLGDVTSSTYFFIDDTWVCTYDPAYGSENSCNPTVPGDHVITGADGSATASATLHVDPGALNHLVLSPASMSITAGGSQAYSAEGFDAYDNSLGDFTSGTAFSISGTGSCTGTSCVTTEAGDHTVTGADGGATGTATLHVTAAALDHLVLTPSSATIAAGESQTYIAEGFDAYDNSLGDVTSATTFSISGGGSCSGAWCWSMVAGDHTVTGTDGTPSGTATLHVNAASLDHLVLSPSGDTISAGGSQAYSATGYDASGNSLGDLTSATTFTIDSGTACPADTCSATLAGDHIITGTDGAATGTATLHVDPGALDHLVLSPASMSITAGGSQAYSATGYDASDNSLGNLTSATTFTIDSGTACPAHLCSATLAGDHTITGTDGTATGTATLHVTPGAAKTLSVSGILNPYPAGSTHSFTAKALDAYGNIAMGYLGTIHFTSSDTKASVPADYTFIAADKGAHTFANTLSPALTLRTAGSQWVRATDKTTASITGSQTVTVT